MASAREMEEADSSGMLMEHVESPRQLGKPYELADFPPEIQETIFSFLSMGDLISANRTSKQLRQALDKVFCKKYIASFYEYYQYAHHKSNGCQEIAKTFYEYSRYKFSLEVADQVTAWIKKGHLWSTIYSNTYYKEYADLEEIEPNAFYLVKTASIERIIAKIKLDDLSAINRDKRCLLDEIANRNEQRLFNHVYKIFKESRKTSYQGITPLMLAVFCRQSSEEIKYLLSNPQATNLRFHNLDYFNLLTSAILANSPDDILGLIENAIKGRVQDHFPTDLERFHYGSFSYLCNFHPGLERHKTTFMYFFFHGGNTKRILEFFEKDLNPSRKVNSLIAAFKLVVFFGYKVTDLNKCITRDRELIIQGLLKYIDYDKIADSFRKVPSADGNEGLSGEVRRHFVNICENFLKGAVDIACQAEKNKKTQGFEHSVLERILQRIAIFLSLEKEKIDKKQINDIFYPFFKTAREGCIAVIKKIIDCVPMILTSSDVYLRRALELAIQKKDLLFTKQLVEQYDAGNLERYQKYPPSSEYQEYFVLPLNRATESGAEEIFDYFLRRSDEQYIALCFNENPVFLECAVFLKDNTLLEKIQKLVPREESDFADIENAVLNQLVQFAFYKKDLVLIECLKKYHHKEMQKYVDSRFGFLYDHLESYFDNEAHPISHHRIVSYLKMSLEMGFSLSRSFHHINILLVSFIVSGEFESAQVLIDNGAKIPSSINADHLKILIEKRANFVLENKHCISRMCNQEMRHFLDSLLILPLTSLSKEGFALLKHVITSHCDKEKVIFKEYLYQWGACNDPLEIMQRKLAMIDLFLECGIRITPTFIFKPGEEIKPEDIAFLIRNEKYFALQEDTIQILFDSAMKNNQPDIIRLLLSAFRDRLPADLVPYITEELLEGEECLAGERRDMVASLLAFHSTPVAQEVQEVVGSLIKADERKEGFEWREMKESAVPACQKIYESAIDAAKKSVHQKMRKLLCFADDNRDCCGKENSISSGVRAFVSELQLAEKDYRNDIYFYLCVEKLLKTIEIEEDGCLHFQDATEAMSAFVKFADKAPGHVRKSMRIAVLLFMALTLLVLLAAIIVINPAICPALAPALTTVFAKISLAIGVSVPVINFATVVGGVSAGVILSFGAGAVAGLFSRGGASRHMHEALMDFKQLEKQK
ncbi:MAG TPA: F-box protein [Gammaproteobacteria bacterium]|jgi:ankyrin repeat protein|nr:F-box protein [Gammaproteobacteria bacterium]